MARPTGRKSARPGKQALDNYYRMLREKADNGDVPAAFALIALSERKAKEVEQ